MRLRDTLPDLIGSLVSVRANHGYLEDLVLATSVGLETLGFHLAKKDSTGSHLNKHGQLKSFRDGLELIRSELPEGILPNWERWIQDAIDTYMGTKHPDRQTPDDLVRMNTWRQSVLVLRSWIARHLGISEKVLMQRL